MKNPEIPDKNEQDRRTTPPTDLKLPGMLLVDVNDPDALAPVTVMTRYADGVDHLDEAGRAVSAKGKPVKQWETESFVKAFSENHDRDAHCVLYGGKGADEKPLALMPRLTKPGVFCFVDEMKWATGIFGGYLAIDYDLPGHAAWTPESLAMVEKLFHEAGEVNPIFKFPTVCYRTAHGLRLVWALYDWINFEGKDGLEDKLIGLVGDAHIAGLRVDTLCRDWTRHFRLPMVRRENDAGQKTDTGEQKYFSISYNRFDLTAKDACPEQVIAYKSDVFRPGSAHKPTDYERCDVARKLFKEDKWSERIGRVPSTVHASTTGINVGVVPSAEQVLQLTKLSERSQKPSRMVGMMKSFIWNLVQKNKNLANVFKVYHMVFESAPMFDQPDTLDGFHSAISSCASTLSKYLQDMPHSTPQLVFAVIYEKALIANQQRVDKGHREIRSTETLHREVWDLVSRFWRNDVAKKEARRIEDEEFESAKAAERERLEVSVEYRQQKIADELMKWMPQLSREQILRQMHHWYILKQGKSFHVLSMTSDGVLKYVSGDASYATLLALIRDSGNDEIIRSTTTDKNGNLVYRDMHELFAECGTCVTQVSYSRLANINRLTLKGDGNGGFDLCLSLCIGGMDKSVPAVFHQECDDWLRQLFGTMYEKCADWLACYRSIEEPIAALEMRRASGTGKGMLVLALKNITAKREISHFNEVFSDFTDTMKDSPLLQADEGLNVHGKRAVDTIKQYVSGEANKVHCKGEAKFSVEGHWRLIFAANSTDMLESSDVLDEDEAAALAVRIIRVVVRKECKEWLDARGGYKFTEGWPSKQLPEHICWLEAERLADIKENRRGKRFLVEGGSSVLEMDSFVSNNIRADIVIRAIGKILRSNFDAKTRFPIEGKIRDAAYLAIDDNHMMVSAEKLTEYLHDQTTNLAGRTQIGAKDVGAILKKLSLDIAPRRKERSGHTGSYHVMSLAKIIQMLASKGYGDDFIGNGVITAEFYKKYLPDIFASIDVAKQEGVQMRATADTPAPAMAPKNYPTSSNTSTPSARPLVFPRRKP